MSSKTQKIQGEMKTHSREACGYARWPWKDKPSFYITCPACLCKGSADLTALFLSLPHHWVFFLAHCFLTARLIFPSVAPGQILFSSTETEWLPSLINFVTLKVFKQSEQTPHLQVFLLENSYMVVSLSLLFTRNAQIEIPFFPLVFPLIVVNEMFPISSFSN